MGGGTSVPLTPRSQKILDNATLFHEQSLRNSLKDRFLAMHTGGSTKARDSITNCITSTLPHQPSLNKQASIKAPSLNEQSRQSSQSSFNTKPSPMISESSQQSSFRAGPAIGEHVQSPSMRLLERIASNRAARQDEDSSIHASEQLNGPYSGMMTTAMAEEGTVVTPIEKLNRQQILELVKWGMRFSDDTKRAEDILSVFTHCLVDDLMTFDEFYLMFEEIAARVELQRYFEENFTAIDTAQSGVLVRDDAIQLTDLILTKFAAIWCSKREILEMKRKLVAVLGERLSKHELLEIYDSMLLTIRIINVTRDKMKVSDEVLDRNNRTQLVEWLLKTYLRSGIYIDENEKQALTARIMSVDQAQDGAIMSIKEIAQLHEVIMEVLTVHNPSPCLALLTPLSFA